MDGVASTLGILIGVYAAGGSSVAMVAATLAGGLAGAFSNAAGVHVSQEVEGGLSEKIVWRSTIGAFISTVLVVIAIAVPLLLLALPYNVIASVLVGLAILLSIGVFVIRSWRIGIEYVLMGLIAAVSAYMVGTAVGLLFV